MRIITMKILMQKQHFWQIYVFFLIETEIELHPHTKIGIIIINNSLHLNFIALRFCLKIFAIKRILKMDLKIASMLSV